MRKLLAFALATTLVAPTLATAAEPGINLGWSNCGTTVSTQNLVFTCDANDATFNIVGSWRPLVDLPDYVGLGAIVHFSVNDALVPDWWALGVGGCREGAIALIDVGTISGCTNPYSGGIQGGGILVEPTWYRHPGLNDFLIRLQWARDSPFNARANTLYSIFVLQLNSSRTVDEGAGVCTGCATAACFALNFVEVFGLQYPSVRIDLADVRNWASWQGGQVGVDVCPNGTPTQNRTWGQIKALYR